MSEAETVVPHARACTGGPREGHQEGHRDGRPEGPPPGPRPIGASVNWSHGGHDLEFPSVPFPSLRILEVAGEKSIRALVARQHQRLKEGPVGGLYPDEPAAFARLVRYAEDFFVEMCGGANDYTETRGKERMRTRHLPFTIDEAGRITWLEALWFAFDEVGFPHEVREEYWAWLEAMSIRMINRRRQMPQPERITYAEACARWPAPGAPASEDA